MKVHKGKRSGHLVDEEDKEPQPAFEPQVEDNEYNLQRGIQMSLEYFQAQVGVVAPVGVVAIREPVSGITRQLPVVKDASTGPSAQPHDDTSVNVVRDTPFPADAETGADTEKSNSEGDTKNILMFAEVTVGGCFNKRWSCFKGKENVELDEGQDGSDPGKTPESRPPSERVLMEED
ncbi:hypothetical protein Tco_0448872 [Tanacetum coccineum]